MQGDRTQSLGFRICSSLIAESQPAGTRFQRHTLEPEVEHQLHELLSLDFQKQWKQKWTLWYGKRASKEFVSSAGDYLRDLWPAGTFGCAESFAQFWNQGYEDASQPPPYCKVMVFKRGIKPVWEDPYNKNGGKFVLRAADHHNALGMYLVLTLRLVFGLLGDLEEFCGSILTIKGPYVWLQLWNRDTNSRELITKTRDALYSLFSKKNVYQVHKVSIRFQKLRKQNPELAELRSALKKEKIGEKDRSRSTKDHPHHHQGSSRTSPDSHSETTSPFLGPCLSGPLPSTSLVLSQQDFQTAAVPAAPVAPAPSVEVEEPRQEPRQELIVTPLFVKEPSIVQQIEQYPPSNNKENDCVAAVCNLASPSLQIVAKKLDSRMITNCLLSALILLLSSVLVSDMLGVGFF